MQEEIIIAGFGGQGVLFAGQLLAYAAMTEGLHVTWIPSYGPEMRGGRARCTVVIADEEIGSPLVRQPSAAVVLTIFACAGRGQPRPKPTSREAAAKKTKAPTASPAPKATKEVAHVPAETAPVTAGDLSRSSR